MKRISISCFRWLTVALVSVMMAACAQSEFESLQAPATPRMMTFTAVCGGADTRLSHEYISDSGDPDYRSMKVKWTAGDSIRVYSSTGESEIFTIVATSISSDGKTATFTGPDMGETENGFVLAYPACDFPKNFQNIFSNLRGQVQKGNEGTGHLNGLDVMFSMVSKLDDPVVFSHDTAILRIEVPAVNGYALQSLTMTSSEDVFGFGTGTTEYSSTMVFEDTDDAGPVYACMVNSGSVDFKGNSQLFFSATYKAMTEPSSWKHYVSNATLSGDKTLDMGLVHNITPANWSESTDVMAYTGPVIPAEGYANGTGEAENPYLISTAEELQKFIDEANGCTGHFKLVKDIHVTATSWPDIRNFQGTFDGAGHTVSGVLNQSFGFFSYVYDAKIMNLHIAADIKTTKYSVGGIAAWSAGNTAIGYCTMSGDIIIEGEELEYEGLTVGGIVGWVSEASTINNCTSLGKINVTANEGSLEIGGIAGCSRVLISYCVSKAEISANIITSGSFRVGGIAGIGAAVTYCINEGSITIDGAGGRSVGGIAGTLSGALLNCRNFGDITSTGDLQGRDMRVGGIAGDIDSDASVHDSQNYGNITTSQTVRNGGDDYVGGICGTGRAYDCCTNAGKVNGVASTGGNRSGEGVDKESTCSPE